MMTKFFAPKAVLTVLTAHEAAYCAINFIFLTAPPSQAPRMNDVATFKLVAIPLLAIFSFVG